MGLQFTGLMRKSTVGIIIDREEIEVIWEDKLNQMYTERELLDLLRSRMISGKGTVYFIDKGEKYNVGISIDKHKI